MSSDFLRNVWLFTALSDDQLDAISNFTFRANFSAGDLIVEEGQTGNGLYVIMSGNVEAVKGYGTENMQVVNKLAAGGLTVTLLDLAGWRRSVDGRLLGIRAIGRCYPQVVVVCCEHPTRPGRSC